jgi:hypothetical protein
MVFSIALTPRSKTPDSEFIVELKLVKADLANPPAQGDSTGMQIVAALHSIAGLTGSFRIDEHGNVRDVSIEAPTGQTQMSQAAQQFVPLLEQALETVVTVLPVEAIGKGARWELDTSNQENGVSSISKAISTLKDSGADGLQIGVVTTRTAPKQNVGDPKEAANLKIDGLETSTLKVKLDRMVVKGQSDSSLALTVEHAAPGGGRESSLQKITLHQTIENAKP